MMVRYFYYFFFRVVHAHLARSRLKCRRKQIKLNSLLVNIDLLLVRVFLSDSGWESNQMKILN